jgi:hypothetical protein
MLLELVYSPTIMKLIENQLKYRTSIDLYNAVEWGPARCGGHVMPRLLVARSPNR